MHHDSKDFKIGGKALYINSKTGLSIVFEISNIVGGMLLSTINTAYHIKDCMPLPKEF